MLGVKRVLQLAYGANNWNSIDLLFLFGGIIVQEGYGCQVQLRGSLQLAGNKRTCVTSPHYQGGMWLPITRGRRLLRQDAQSKARPTDQDQ